MKKITIADYLIQELNKLGISNFYGLPGDYNFEILDAVIKNPQTNWIGCINELNAGYAADGYARINGYGALITTYGVGELSAINAIAGSYAESVAVIKITGIPATKFIKNKTMLHHNFQEPDYKAFERAYSNVTTATTTLTAENAKEEIDRLLKIFVKEKKPVYISIPVDVSTVEISDPSPAKTTPEINHQKLKAATEHAARLINKSKAPTILADVLIDRYQSKEAFKDFMKKMSCPTATLLMGKSIVEEDNEYYMGTFLGSYGNPKTYEKFKNSDCVISVGAVFSDLNTARFSLPFTPDNHINIQGNYCIIENVCYDEILMCEFLRELTNTLTEKKGEKPDWQWYYPKAKESTEKELTTEYLFSRLQEFFEENDMIFAETGIITYAMAEMKLPKNVTLQNQVLWGSIGWATPAMFGGSMADKSRRAILITGEGSHQLSALEVGNMLKHKLTPVIFVLNNSGYTIERLLSHDPQDEFNNIIKINYTKIPELFSGQAATYQVKTEKELDEILCKLSSKNINKSTTPQKLHYIELFTDAMDVPEITNKIIKNIK